SSRLGDLFFEEAERLLDQELGDYSVTTVQALGIMSSREASCGRDLAKCYHAGQSTRLAHEMGLNLVGDEGDKDDILVRTTTFWGAFALNQ
ncbi:uncharacterized protein BDZ99DRAFT_385797, partial [Mytilinidion resinicola]